MTYNYTFLLYIICTGTCTYYTILMLLQLMKRTVYITTKLWNGKTGASIIMWIYCTGCLPVYKLTLLVSASARACLLYHMSMTNVHSIGDLYIQDLEWVLWHLPSRLSYETSLGPCSVGVDCLCFNPLIHMGFILILSLLCGVGKCVFVDKHNNKISITNTSTYVCIREKWR